MNTYHALTIGPIYKTLQSVKSTKAIWGASYLLSYTMKLLMEGVKKADKDVDFLMPYVEWDSDDSIKSVLPRVGLLPDRAIFTSSALDATGMSTITAELITSLAEILGNDLASATTPKHVAERFSARQTNHYKDAAAKQNIAAFLRQYLHIYSLHIAPETLADEAKKRKAADPDKPANDIQIINGLLDSLELQSNFAQKEDAPYLSDFLENVYYNALVRREFKERNDEPRFPMTVQIAAAEYRNENRDAFRKFSKTLEDARKNERKDEKGIRIDEQQEFLKKFRTDDKREKNDKDKAFPTLSLKQRHKYITTMLADGDNMGAFINKIFEAETDKAKAQQLFKDFSQNLGAFTQASVLLIRRFGGVCVYAGGDDLLFFAPVHVSKLIVEDTNADLIGIILNSTLTTADSKNQLYQDIKQILEDDPNGKSVFWLADRLEALFKKFIAENLLFDSIIKACEVEGKKPSLSFGVNISYYKHPLNEALKHSKYLLEKVAKGGNDKNKLAFHVLKHSGQFYSSVFRCSEDEYKKFSKLLEESAVDDALLSSIAHKIEAHQTVLLDIAREMPSNKSARLAHLFKNNFDEEQDAGKMKPKDKFLRAARELLEQILPDNLDPEETNHEKLDEPLKKLYASLRFAHFLNAKASDE